MNRKKSNLMKQTIFIFSMLLCNIHLNAQLKVDAGNDVVLCFSDSSTSTAQLGGFPVASGGVEPYTYTWSGKIWQNYGPKDSMWVYASYFLNDTTKSHPTFKRGEIPFNWPVFNMKVEDASGDVQCDSVKIIDASIWSLNSYMPPRTIKRGDSVQFYGDIYFKDCYNNYNFLPFKYAFSPTYGLSDSIDLYGWAKPDTSTTYYLQVINSAGCVAKMEYLRVIVDTTTVSNNAVINQPTQCYYALSDLIINLPQKQRVPYQVTITTANGAIIHSGKYSNRNLRLSDLNLKENQLYIVSIIDGDERIAFKLIGN